MYPFPIHKMIAVYTPAYLGSEDVFCALEDQPLCLHPRPHPLMTPL